MYKFLLFLLLSLMPLVSNADDLIIMGMSQHVQTQTWHKEQNFGLGIRIEDGIRNMPTSFGVYRNSFDRVGVYLLVEPFRSIKLTPEVSFSLPMGFVSGYENTVVVALPLFSVRLDKSWTMDIMTLPPLGQQGIFAVQLRWKL